MADEVLGPHGGCQFIIVMVTHLSELLISSKFWQVSHWSGRRLLVCYRWRAATNGSQGGLRGV